MKALGLLLLSCLLLAGSVSAADASRGSAICGFVPAGKRPQLRGCSPHEYYFLAYRLMKPGDTFMYSLWLPEAIAPGKSVKNYVTIWRLSSLQRLSVTLNSKPPVRIEKFPREGTGGRADLHFAVDYQARTHTLRIVAKSTVRLDAILYIMEERRAIAP